MPHLALQLKGDFVNVTRFVPAEGVDAALLLPVECTGCREAHPNAVVRNYVSDIREMADRAGLPQPGVAIIPSDQPNAFATGRNPQNAAVAATTGILRTLSYEELAGVMAQFRPGGAELVRRLRVGLEQGGAREGAGRMGGDRGGRFGDAAGPDVGATVARPGVGGRPGRQRVQPMARVGGPVSARALRAAPARWSAHP